MPERLQQSPQRLAIVNIEDVDEEEQGQRGLGTHLWFGGKLLYRVGRAQCSQLDTGGLVATPWMDARLRVRQIDSCHPSWIWAPAPVRFFSAR
jgi:hypothetical protein